MALSGRSKARRRVVANSSNARFSRVELTLDLVDRVGVLGPLLPELAEQLKDLLTGLFDDEVVERLADDPEKGEQG